ncbi:hypothetical protein E2562_038660 [Oryza meyeriana var. granulata]|uniref:Uncharacterized protein n=1 Tax=Oryza meyeriana var. granulata TaxID=110450 RepID=A0A6G1FGS5_9ORYZ|nr:hypothetical protein E2562_038660 [Oryza meyeriana var. granulata]
MVNTARRARCNAHGKGRRQRCTVSPRRCGARCDIVQAVRGISDAQELGTMAVQLGLLGFGWRTPSRVGNIAWRVGRV